MNFKRILSTLILFSIVFLGIRFFINLRTETDVALTNSKEMDAIVTEEIGMSWMEDSNVLFTEIDDVSGGDSSGKAYILRSDAGLKHYVEAYLPTPEEGYSYEGWLVRKQPTLDFFSTGVMIVKDDMYVLEYESDMNYLGYDEVVITLESSVDETPETHILEGIAK